MIKQHFVRFCLVAIVLLLGIIAFRLNPPDRVEAAGSDCLVEGVQLGKMVASPQLTQHCKQRMSEGWHLAAVSMGSFVWIK
jgi:hypothetical protein